MPKPYASAVLPVSADRVWEAIRDFGSIADWHPGIASAELKGGAGDQVGAVRRLTGPGGELFVERLLILDDTARSYTYEILESPFPVRAYEATMRVTPVTDTGYAFAEWTATYDADAEDEARLTKTFSRGIFATGLSALRDRFS
ncbi:SRPBCC family protein [Actinomadura sp. DC4]|uniref:SRPBCC family protein n=1 Tax=Actinomadura sp. DC4 TaxID=3055069 RepID=UPI0025B07D96|nr:SRPBCC family protein [Actinomadura sp. DC4]MDN3355863.1 SRPBCC family protein [Actinomadura sp. DC4]